MRAGNLRNKAIVQSIGAIVDDEFGGVAPVDFQDFKTVWCNITPLSGKENFNGAVDVSKVTHKIKIRYTTGINASQRLSWSGRVFNFVSVINFGERDKEIVILAEEQINGN